MRSDFKPKILAFWDDGDEPSIFERPEFIAYQKKIMDILRKSLEPQSIADIHRRLGMSVKREWTMDALESPDVICDGKFISRYWMRHLVDNRQVKWNDKAKVSEDKYHRAIPRAAITGGIG